MKKLNVTAVSYLNTKPLLYGLIRSGLDEQIHLQLDIPSECARKLVSGEVDLGLIPVAAIPELNEPHLISNFCIGTDGAVKTVSIFSEVPMQEIEKIYLDYHSRTSVALTRILLRDHWKQQPELIAATPGFVSEIKGTTAGLVIGDRAIGLEEQYPFVYDLGVEWKKHTGLPFVFAAWVSNRPLPADFVRQFNDALAEGIRAIPQLMFLLPSPQPNFDLKAYFTENIQYDLDIPKKKALSIFLNELQGYLQPSLREGLAEVL
jgi:chorismate dehydratase